MLSDEIIGFETAQLAKERGFLQYCKYSYWEGDLTAMTPGYYGMTENEYASYLKHPRHYAPSQALFARWLREVKNLHVYADTCDNDGHWCFTVISIIMDTDSGIHYEPEDSFDSYEEALEAGLYAALDFV